MKVYVNSHINFKIEDLENVEEKYDTYIYTQYGIYQKYKKHFFLCDCENNSPKMSKTIFGQQEYLIEENSFKLNKQKILTSIPYHCYFVNRFTRRCILDNDIVFVKELDNDHFESCYFVLNHINQIKHIGLYIK